MLDEVLVGLVLVVMFVLLVVLVGVVVYVIYMFGLIGWLKGVVICYVNVNVMFDWVLIEVDDVDL